MLDLHLQMNNAFMSTLPKQVVLLCPLLSEGTGAMCLRLHWPQVLATELHGCLDKAEQFGAPLHTGSPRI